jgi:radical SAM superfamily enzyme YgiQ (UPF0313 family)
MFRVLKSVTLLKLMEMIRQGKFRLILRALRVMGAKEAWGKLHGVLKGGIYPFGIPPVEIKRDLDFLVLELPARYQPMMPNGLGYLNNILTKCGIRFQVIDLNIIFYHRYHARRILGEARLTAPSGYIMKADPWENANIDEWFKPEVIEYFWPQVEEVLQEIMDKRPKAVGLSVHATNRVLAREFVTVLRAKMPEVTIVIGGYDCFHRDVGPKLLQDFDYMVIGEAELTLNALASALKSGERPKDLPGIISRYDSPERKWTPTPLLEDIDSIGFPKYEWTDVSVYQTCEGNHLVPITASRGCHWGRCRFCAEVLPFRKRQPQKVAEEMEHFTSHGLHSFHFNESDVNGDPENLHNICSEVIRRGLKVQMCGQLRIDKRNSKEYFEHLAEAGFTHLRFGVDGWSKNTLNLQLKGYTMDMVFQNLRDCHQSGIFTTVNIVIGVPGETEDDIDESIENMVRCKGYIDCVESFNTLILACGSEYYKDSEKYRIRFRGDKSEIYRNHPYFIPADLWYSEGPFIDQTIRLRRVNKIAAEIYGQGVEIGAFASRVIEDLKKGESYPMHEEA